MKLTYIYHSSFLLEMHSAVLLFDYFRGQIPAVPADKPLYIFASHAHDDHFSGKIFDLVRERTATTYYILSDDIPQSAVPSNIRENPNVHIQMMGPHETLQLSQEPQFISITTLASNDAGVAFVCNFDGRRIYFAGDLNNWWWDGDDEDARLERIYHEELERIRGMHFKIAFIPVDSRLGDDYWRGMNDFITYCEADALVPMHIGPDRSVLNRLMKLEGTKIPKQNVLRIDETGGFFIK